MNSDENLFTENYSPYDTFKKTNFNSALELSFRLHEIA